MTSFRIYNPLGQLLAGGGTGGGTIPLTGGTIKQNWNISPPNTVKQSAAPVGNDDLVNKQYTDANFLKLSGSTVTGQITQLSDPVADTDLANKKYVDTKVADPASLPLATGSARGIIKLGGDLDSTSTADAPAIAPNKVTYDKIQQEVPAKILGVPSSGLTTPSNYGALTLGSSMSLTGPNGSTPTGSTLNSAISFFSGTNPNITAPVDRPATQNVLYVGTDGSLWIYDTTTTHYISFFPSFPTNRIVPKYIVTMADISGGAANAVTPMPELNIIIQPNQRMRLHYILRCITLNGANTLNFAFPNWVAGVKWTTLAYLPAKLSQLGIFNVVDMTDSTGITTTVALASSDILDHTLYAYVIKGEVVNKTLNPVTWTIGRIASENESHGRKILAGSSVMYSIIP